MKRIIVAIAIVFGLIFGVNSANAHTAEIEFMVVSKHENYTMAFSNERPQEFLETFKLLDAYYLMATFENKKEMMETGWEIAKVLPFQLNFVFFEDFDTHKFAMYIFER